MLLLLPIGMQTQPIQSKLYEKFTELKIKNPSYSLRAFAKKLGVNSGALSSIMNGKRPVGAKLTFKIMDKLYLDPQERSEILSSLPSYLVQSKKEGTHYTQLSADEFKGIAQWYHFAILSLMNTKGFKNDNDWISSQLGINTQTVEAALERLLRLGLIRQTKNKKLRRSAVKYRTTDDILNISLQKSHADNLELAKESLERDPVLKRDFSAITLAIDPKKISLAKEKIRKFQDEMSSLLEKGERTEVYKLCLQFFPLTKGGK